MCYLYKKDTRLTRIVRSTCREARSFLGQSIETRIDLQGNSFSFMEFATADKLDPQNGKQLSNDHQFRVYCGEYPQFDQRER